MGVYVARRLLNYAILLFVAVSLTYLLAATQLDPRSLYEVRNPPLDPGDRRADPARPEPQRPGAAAAALLDLVDRHRHRTGTGASRRAGGSVNEEVSRRIWVSLRLITIGSLLGIGAAW